MRLTQMMTGDQRANRVVPSSGITAQLVVFASAAMGFLAVFALALSFASGRLAERWWSELAQSATIHISAPMDTRADQTDRALRILETTPGVAFARALDASEQQALLEPWFGASLDVSALPLPQLIEIVRDENDFDAEGLRLRLAAEVPDAVFDDHGAWRAPLIAAAGRLNALATICIALLFCVMAAMITLAANTALSANAQVIAVLRLVGATDAYIARAFVRRFTLRAILGAVGGVVAGALAVLSLPAAAEPAGLLTGLAFEGGEWLWALLVPATAGMIAFLATRWAAARALRSLA